MAASERVVVLMPPDEKTHLVELARRANVSIGEFLRRLVREQAAAAALEAELAQHRPEVEALLDALEGGDAAPARRVGAGPCRCLTGWSRD